MLPESRWSLGLILLPVLAASPGLVAPAQGPATPKEARHPSTMVRSAPLAELSTNERGVIRVYFKQHPRKVRPLPPGIARNLIRGKLLPPGIAKTRLPEPLLGVLPILPGYQRVIVGDRIVLLAPRGIVADIMGDAFK